MIIDNEFMFLKYIIETERFLLFFSKIIALVMPIEKTTVKELVICFRSINDVFFFIRVM